MNKDNELLSLPSLVSPMNKDDTRISFHKEYMNLNYDYGIDPEKEIYHTSE